MNIIRQAAKQIMQFVLPRQSLIVRGPQAGSAQYCHVYLTFDDGPDPVETPAVLDQLSGSGIQGTFFVIGHKAEARPDLIQRIVAEGHELGNHTWLHGEPDAVSTGEFMEEIRRTDLLLQSLTGRSWPLVRPPRGKLSPGKLLGLLRTRRPAVLWTLDPRDYRIRQAAELEGWLADTTPADGDILLLHDNQPWAKTLIPQLARWRESYQVCFRCLGDALGHSAQPPALTRECPV